jgi:hypothetical protein
MQYLANVQCFAMNCCRESGARDSELFGLPISTINLLSPVTTCCIANLNKTHLDHAAGLALML